jgi:hypothetical protein
VAHTTVEFASSGHPPAPPSTVQDAAHTPLTQLLPPGQSLFWQQALQASPVPSEHASPVGEVQSFSPFGQTYGAPCASGNCARPPPVLLVYPKFTFPVE